MNAKARLLAALAALAVAALVSSGAMPAGQRSPLGDPASFIVRTIEEKAAGRYAEVWQTLYPLHQRIAPQELYVLCERTIVFPGRLVSVHVVSIRPGPVAVAGVTRPVSGEAVTVRAVVRTPILPSPVVVTHTFHAVAAAGHWTWILSPSRFRLYERGGCGVRYAA
jgi:hypothetical protein